MSNIIETNHILTEILADQTRRRNQQKMIEELMDGPQMNKYSEIWTPNQPEQDIIQIPINSFQPNNPIYINPKQYWAILTRRAKKVRQKIKEAIQQQSTQKKNKRFKQRSRHAKQRQRDQNGKFITKNY